MNKVQRPLPEMALGASAPKWRIPKFEKSNMVNDMVYTYTKV